MTEGTKEPPALEERENLDVLDGSAPPEMVRRHVLRYNWAKNAIRERLGRKPAMVIDFACGTGYGSLILAEDAKVVLGRDKNEASVNLARDRYRHVTENDGRDIGYCDFKVRDASQVQRHADTDPRFDAFVCIETIEHLRDPGVLLRNTLNLLIPGGVLVLSTPLKAADGKLRSKYHLFEWTKSEAKDAVRNAGFSDLRFYDVLQDFTCLTARRPL